MKHIGSALAGLQGFLLFGHLLQFVGWHILFVKFILFVLILAAAFFAFVKFGNQFQSHGIGYASGFTVLFFGLILLGIT